MSKYGEVKDLLDKIKMFSNLRIHAYESGLRGSGSFVAREADDLLEQIEKDLDDLVELSFNQQTDMEINEKLFPKPLDDWQQGIDKNISELKKVTEYLSAILRK